MNTPKQAARRRAASALCAALLVAGCAQDPEAVARQVEWDIAGYGLRVDASTLSPGTIAAARSIMSSDRTEADKLGLLRSELARGNRLRDSLF